MDCDIIQDDRTSCTQCLGANTPMDRVGEDGHPGHKHELHIGIAVKLRFPLQAQQKEEGKLFTSPPSLF